MFTPLSCCDQIVYYVKPNIPSTGRLRLNICKLTMDFFLQPSCDILNISPITCLPSLLVGFIRQSHDVLDCPFSELWHLEADAPSLISLCIAECRPTRRMINYRKHGNHYHVDCSQQHSGSHRFCQKCLFVRKSSNTTNSSRV